MNRRRFLGLAAVAPLLLGTRVPEPPAPSLEEAHAAGFQDGYAAAENAIQQQGGWLVVPTGMTLESGVSDARAEFDALDAEFRRGLKTWDEFRETECGSDPYGALAERAAWNPADMSMERMREVSRRELGLPLDRPSTDAEIAAMARRDRLRQG